MATAADSLIKNGFLASTLGTRIEPSKWESEELEWRWLGQGVLFLRPKAPSNSKQLVILSAGIHGNETAPIEWIDGFCAELLLEKRTIRHAILLILGNPEAIRAEKRFVEENLNRLFPPSTESTTLESERARELLRLTEPVARQYERILHLDLHTAIRKSLRPRFAICPEKASHPMREATAAFLAQCGIQAAIRQQKPSRTFSGWSCHHLGALSFTMEMGQVAPFGQNPPGMLSRLDSCIQTVLESTDVLGEMALFQKPGQSLPELYDVSDEVINSGNGFRLLVAEDAPNFTELPEGTGLWQDANQVFRIAGATRYLLFPNSKVGPGQRAALLAVKMDDQDGLPVARS